MEIPFRMPSLYAAWLGGLQYLTLTHPDIAFSVNHVCQFTQSSCTTHLLAVKRILRFVKETIIHGLTFAASYDNSLWAFTDADWAGCQMISAPLAFILVLISSVIRQLSLGILGCRLGWLPNDRRSTKGACIYLGPNLISWTAKKQLTVSLKQRS